MGILDGLQDVTFDTASCASLYLGNTAIDVQKFSPSKVSVKKDKLRPIGSMIATKRTPGVAEVADGSFEVLETVWMSVILPRLPVHGGSDVTFTILQALKHPTIIGSSRILLDRVTLAEFDGPELVGDEKGAVRKFAYTAMDRYEAGIDGVWKTLYRRPGVPSALAVAILKF